MPATITFPIEFKLTPEAKALLHALGTLGQRPETTLREGTVIAIDPTIGTPGHPAPAIGQYWPGQGGIYGGVRPAILDQPAAHMVWSEPQWESLVWGERGRVIHGANSRIDGRANTRALLNAGGCAAAETAAKHTADGHSDFFLPAQFDLFIASLLAQPFFKPEGWYWSSTQDSAYYAFAQGFEDGTSNWDDKGSEFRVRALRLIQL